MAADAWNTKVRQTYPNGGGALVCERRGAPRPPNDPALCPPVIDIDGDGDDDDDGYTLTIRVVDKLPSDCVGTAPACVYPTTVYTTDGDTEPQPIANQELFIPKAPGITLDLDRDGIGEQYVVRWTTDPDNHRIPTKGENGIPGVYIDLTGIVMHEIGHPFGLIDLNDERVPNRDQYDGYLMSGEYDLLDDPITEVPVGDILLLGDQYEGR